MTKISHAFLVAGHCFNMFLIFFFHILLHLISKERHKIIVILCCVTQCYKESNKQVYNVGMLVTKKLVNATTLRLLLKWPWLLVGPLV